MSSTARDAIVTLFGRRGQAATETARDVLQRNEVGEGAMAASLVHAYLAGPDRDAASRSIS